jgi:hypothetical protein
MVDKKSISPGRGDLPELTDEKYRLDFGQIYGSKLYMFQI